MKYNLNKITERLQSENNSNVNKTPFFFFRLPKNSAGDEESLTGQSLPLNKGERSHKSKGDLKCTIIKS